MGKSTKSIKSIKGTKRGKIKSYYGYTLVEILIVVFIFAVLMLVTIQSLSQTLKGSKKSENQVKARQNVDYTISSMERLIRNARSISCPNQYILNYVDEYENQASFACLPNGSTNGYIASSSARMTNSEISINCSLAVFVCSPGGNGVPPSVRIVVSGKKAGAAGSEESSVRSETTVLLRTYD